MKLATIHFDGGGLSPGPVTAACTVQFSDGSVKEDVKRFDQGTHNMAEWQALILGLRIALKRGERHVVVKGDSMLVVKQINREWRTKNEALRSLRAEAEGLLVRCETWRVEWIPRKENRRTDELGRSRQTAALGVCRRRLPLRTRSDSAASLALRFRFEAIAAAGMPLLRRKHGRGVEGSCPGAVAGVLGRFQVTVGVGGFDLASDHARSVGRWNAVLLAPGRAACRR